MLVTKKRVLLLLNNKLSHPNHGTDCGEAVLNVYRLSFTVNRLPSIVYRLSFPLTEQRPTNNEQRPPKNEQRPTTNEQRPTTNEQRTTTS